MLNKYLLNTESATRSGSLCGICCLLDWFKNMIVAQNQRLGLEGPQGPSSEPCNLLARHLPCHPLPPRTHWDQGLVVCRTTHTGTQAARVRKRLEGELVPGWLPRLDAVQGLLSWEAGGLLGRGQSREGPSQVIIKRRHREPGAPESGKPGPCQQCLGGWGGEP